MIILARKNGRLGNRLALAAHFAASAMSRGVRVVNPTLDEYADFLEEWRGDLWGRTPPRRSLIPALPALRRAWYLTVKSAAYALRRFWPRGPLHEVVDIGIHQSLDLSDPDFVRRAQRKAILCIGWLFRDDEAVREHGETLRRMFRPLREHRVAARTAVGLARQSADIVVGVHIRHGDYRTFLGGKYYYTLEQYRRFMLQMRALFPERRVAFVVCSDAEHPLSAFENLEAFRGPGHLIADMAALAECDYIIGPPSTFSYWASFAGQRPFLHLESPDQAIDLGAFITADLADKIGGEAP